MTDDCSLHPMVNAYTYPSEIPHLLIHGPATEWKYNSLHALLQKHTTTLSHVLYMNCAHIPSTQHVEYLQSQVYSFAQIRSANIRFVVFDHASFLTTESQAILRRYIEQFSTNTRFVFIVSALVGCKLITPILSRLYKVYIPTSFSGIYMNDPNVNVVLPVHMSCPEQYEWVNQSIQSAIYPAQFTHLVPMNICIQFQTATWKSDALAFMYLLCLYTRFPAQR